MRFSEETEAENKKSNYIFQNEKYDWMLADFDRLIVGQAGLECKTVSPYSADKWKDGEVPLRLSFAGNSQHYLLVSGYEYWYIAAFDLRT